MAFNFSSSIQPWGTSKARAERVLATVKLAGESDVVPERAPVAVTEPEDEMMSSVTPTLQCAGYTGIAYAKISLYDVEEGRADRIDEVGGWLVNELSE